MTPCRLRDLIYNSLLTRQLFYNAVWCHDASNKNWISSSRIAQCQPNLDATQHETSYAVLQKLPMPSTESLILSYDK